VAGPYLLRFAQDSVWREDHKREASGSQVDRIVALAMANKPSVDFCGYWQRVRVSLLRELPASSGGRVVSIWAVLLIWFTLSPLFGLIFVAFFRIVPRQPRGPNHPYRAACLSGEIKSGSVGASFQHTP